jgi:hypothetical protein
MFAAFVAISGYKGIMRSSIDGIGNWGCKDTADEGRSE